MLQNIWNNNLLPFINANWSKMVSFLFVLVFGFIALKLIVKLFRRAIKRSRLNNAAGDFLTSILRVVALLIYIIALLSMLGVPTTSLVALLTAFSLAISLAVQDTFANLASGIVLIVNKPFVEGDFVEVAGISGVVDTITISSTKLHTGDNKVVIVPNSAITSASITNYSTMPTRRVDLTFSVAYGTDIEAAKALIQEVVSKHEKVLQDPAPMVRLSEHAASSLDILTRVWVNNADYWAVSFDLKEQVLATFAANGIEIPFNQLDVHIVK